MKLKFLLFLVAAAILLDLGPAAAGQASFTVGHPWFRYLLSQIPAGGFMVLQNHTAQPIILTGARSPACGMAMLHQSVNSSGMDRMMGVKSVTIPAHGEFAFAPGGYHVMCMQPKMSVGGTAPVTLLFQSREPVTVQFKVEGPSGPSAR